MTSFSLLLTNQIHNSYGIFDLIILLRCTRLEELTHSIIEHLKIAQNYPTICVLTKLFYIIIYMAHIFGCGFHFIAYTGMNTYG